MPEDTHPHPAGPVPPSGYGSAPGQGGSAQSQAAPASAEPLAGQPAPAAPAAGSSAAGDAATAPGLGAAPSPAEPVYAPAAGSAAAASGFAASPAPATAQPWPSAPAPVPPAPQPGKKGNRLAKVLIICAMVVLVVAIMAGCTVSVVNTVSGQSASGGTEITSNSVAVIDIDSTIQYDGTACSPDGLKALLDEAASNSHIKAVVLRVNSGGGVATAGEEMATYVKEFRQETGKPVVVSSASSNASAAYEISSQASYVYVARTTSIGSIGTALQLVDYSELLQMLGISVENITSSSSKDSTYGTRKLTDEEREHYQSQVDQINETFIQNVSVGRNMTEDSVRALATGLTFTGVEAVQNGLADEIGTKEDAVQKAAELAGCPNCETVTLRQSSSSDLSALMDLLSESKTTVTADQLAAALKELESNGSIAK